MTAPATAAPAFEAPSGKDAAYENFPVGSWLLPARLRPHVASFYAFARAIDDVADSPVLGADEKLARLDGFAAALTDAAADAPGLEKAAAMRASLAGTGVQARHCLDLISAFKQDAVKRRYADWDELMDYCDRSAAPVGRYLLDLHGEDPAGYAQSDALCNALQVLNHLQDCREDYLLLDRVYLPAPWFAEAGAEVGELLDGQASPAMRAVLDRALAETRPLIETAADLPGVLHDRRLAMESAAIVGIARRLARLLETQDPLARRVALSGPQYMISIMCGAGAALLGTIGAKRRAS